jgi:hypothetical protein
MATKKEESPVRKKSENIVESRIMARARSDAGIYGQRMLLRLVEYTQRYIRGDNFDRVLKKDRIEVGIWGDALFRFRVSSILSGEDDKNHFTAKKAISFLVDSKIEFEDEDVYETTHILGRAKLYKNSGVAEILVMGPVWQAMLDFSKGFLQYDLEVAAKLKSEYSLILYKELCGMKHPISYSIESLRNLFHIKPEQYTKKGEVIDKVVKRVQKELDAVSNVSFTFTTYAAPEGGKKRGRAGTAGITITPVRKVGNMSTDETRRLIHPKKLLGNELYGVLENLDFDAGGIQANIGLFETAMKKMGQLEFIDWLQSIKGNALRANTSVQGYVVNATKKMLASQYGVTFESKQPSGVFEEETPHKLIVDALREVNAAGEETDMTKTLLKTFGHLDKKR